MNAFRRLLGSSAVVLTAMMLAWVGRAEDAPFKPLFPGDSLDAWQVSHWSDVSQQPRAEGEAWRIEDGVLEGLGKHTWLYSKREYGDFTIRFDWKITERGNGGLGLRFPPRGDPAYTGMEIQIVDAEDYYRGNARLEQITGSIYDEVAPVNPIINPEGQWNTYEVTCRGSKVKIVLNDKTIIDIDTAEFTEPNQEKGPALAERPRKGRIGFQNLNGRITIRNAKIREWNNTQER